MTDILTTAIKRCMYTILSTFTNTKQKEPPTIRLTAEPANRLRHGDICENYIVQFSSN